jgi:hypothetical protein
MATVTSESATTLSLPEPKTLVTRSAWIAAPEDLSDPAGTISDIFANCLPHR